MIKFDANSIYDRLKERMQRNPDWKIISNSSVVSSLLRSTSEINAETARYAEYLFKESKWDSAENPSSILAMARMLGYKPSRKISSRGILKVSADPRIHLIGTGGLYSSSLLDENNKNAKSQLKEINWQRVPTNKEVHIGPECTVKDSKGNSYVASPKIFAQDSYFTDIDIIQGVRKTAEIDIETIREVATSSKLDPYLYIPITIQNCENAGDPLSMSYFKVKIKKLAPNGLIDLEEYRVTNTLLLSSFADKDVEVYNDMYNQNLFYLKFNNDPSRGITLDISTNSNILSIQVSYIESAGAKGNVLTTLERFTLTNVPAYSSGNTAESSFIKLYGINPKAISGGKDEETVDLIKEKAPKYYMKNYTAGTKEAYENTISNLIFNIGGRPTIPTKVNVYGGFSEKTISGQTILQPVTYITFLADGLEDLIQKDVEEPFKDIENSLNYYLYKLKSPQDTLKFIPPSYVPFAVGINCEVRRENVPDLSALSVSIRETIEKEWGPDSPKLDFGRNFSPSKFESLIHSKFKEIDSISTEVEAVTKVSWSNAQRIKATVDVDDPELPSPDPFNTGVFKHTIRAPFKFNPLFLGKNMKAFREGKEGATYIMRIDVLYKRPINLPANPEFHTTIFIEDIENRKNDAFYIRNTDQQNLWSKKVLEESSDYNVLKNNVDILNTANQIYYRNHLYSDNEYTRLKAQMISDDLLINSHRIHLGCLDDFLVYYSNPSTSSIGGSESSGSGWIELSFEPLYDLLTKFALKDNNLLRRLKQCPLSNLNCGKTGGSTDEFSIFKGILRDYVDVYISMRPIDSKLDIPLTNNIEDSNKERSSAVLYIDSKDSAVRDRTEDQSQILNLSGNKRNRMISIDCQYKE